MLLADAILEPRSAPDSSAAAWCSRIASGMSVGELLTAVSHGVDGTASPTPESVVSELLAMERRGQLEITVPPADHELRQVYDGLDRSDAAVHDPSIQYVVTYERNWPQHAELYDFVGASDRNGLLKAFERDLYLQHLTPYLDRLAPGAAILDAGCGVGRFAVPLAARGFRVSCVDASVSALKCAAAHVARSGARLDTVSAYLSDVRRMTMFGDERFAATLALEVVCYQADAEASVAELTRVTAPGGFVFVSVEAPYGSLIADPKIGVDHAEAVLAGHLEIPGEITVRYFSKDSLRALVTRSGLECLEIIGTHYVADGALARLLDDDMLADPARRASALKLDGRCASDPVLAPLARAWLAICRKGSSE